MSFFSYIGKSLGAGSAPIRSGLQTAGSDIAFREARDDAPNRKEARELEMAGLRRDERSAQATEEETNRLAREQEQLARVGVSGPQLGVTPAEVTPRTTMGRAPSQRPAGLGAGAGMTTGVAGANGETETPAGIPTPSTAARGFNPAGATDKGTLQVELDALNKQIADAGAGGVTSPALIQPLIVRAKELSQQIEAAPEAINLDRKIQPYEMFGDIPSMRGGARTAPTTAGVQTSLPTGPTTAQPATPRASAQGYNQFRPSVDSVLPETGFDEGFGHSLASMLLGGESNFGANTGDPNQRYKGAMQLGPDVARSYNVDPDDPQQAIRGAMLYARDNAAILQRAGFEVTPELLVLAHNQGAAGAKALLENPTMNVGEALDKAPDRASGARRAAGQAWMKGRDVKDVSAREFVEMAAAYYGKYSPDFSGQEGFRNINPDVYINDPEALTFDMQRVQFRYDQSRERGNQDLRLVNRRDANSVRESVDRARAAEDQLVELSGIYAQLQVTKGLANARGGDTSYLNAVLSGTYQQPIEVVPSAGDNGIVYQVTAGGQPVTDYIDYDSLQQFTMRLIDSQYDAELRAAEAQASSKFQEIILRGQVDLSVEMAKLQAGTLLGAEREQTLAKLNSQLDTQRGLALRSPFTELSTTAEGEPVVMNARGDMYKITSRRERIGGKNQDIMVLEPLPAPL